MTTRKTTTTELRRCTGSARFGIEPHEAPISDFPEQPSRKDGLGRMCKPHWRQYTNALRKAAVARKATEEATPTQEPVAEDTGIAAPIEPAVAEPEVPPARRTRRAKAEVEPAAEVDEVATA